MNDRELYKMVAVKWYDPDTPDTVMIATQAYGLKLLEQKPTGGSDESWACLYGPEASVDRFMADYDEDTLEPFESKRELDDDEYQDWLSVELAKFGCLYVPTYVNDEDEEEG